MVQAETHTIHSLSSQEGRNDKDKKEGRKVEVERISTNKSVYNKIYCQYKHQKRTYDLHMKTCMLDLL